LHPAWKNKHKCILKYIDYKLSHGKLLTTETLW